MDNMIARDIECRAATMRCGCDECRAAAHRSRADVVMVAKIDEREPRTLYDAAGHKIGEVTIDGDTGTARITDPEVVAEVVAAIKAQAAAGCGFSMGYRVTLEPLPATPSGNDRNGAR